MTDIDTDAARAAWGGNAYVYPAGVILDLCDALDAARAERDSHDDVACPWQTVADGWQARAEAAEARARHADERCDMHARDCAEAEAELDEAITRSGAQWKRATDAEAKFEKLTEQYRDVVGELLDRAEAAEAALAQYKQETFDARTEAADYAGRIDEAMDRAEAAEARIVVIRALHVRTVDPWDCDACERIWPCETYRALTEDTNV